MAKKVFTDESLGTLINEIKSYTDDAVSTKADSSHTHDYLPLSGGELTGALKVPKLSATNTSAYIGSMTTPFQQVYTKSVYMQDGANETIDYGDFRVQTKGTTSVVGKTQLSVGNSTASGKEGNSRGIIKVYGTGAYSHQIQGDASTNRTLTLPDKDGTLSVDGHSHSASNITSGILPVERGGTGNSNGYIRAGQLSGSSIGTMATAEGRNTTASGSYSHAEGNYTEATGSSSHAEGQNTNASGVASHAEGENSTASGSYSHAEGENTRASSKNQHVQGRFNKEDSSGTYAHIVGNGESDSSRSNAHTIDWDGNAWFAGDVYVGGTSQSEGVKLAKLVDTGWITLTLETDVSAGGANNPLQYRKIGNVVYIRGTLTVTNMTTSPKILSSSIPSGYRPSSASHIILCPVGTKSIAQVSINTDGIMRLVWAQPIESTYTYTEGSLDIDYNSLTGIVDGLQINTSYVVD